jgi:hypothetical protein
MPAVAAATPMPMDAPVVSVGGLVGAREWVGVLEVVWVVGVIKVIGLLVAVVRMELSDRADE